MKNFLLRAAALLVAICFTVIGNAQTVDEILNNHVTAIGGADKWKLVKSTRVEGYIEVQGVQITFTQQAIHNVGVRVDAEFQGMQVIDICTPTKGWSQNPFAGQNELQPISEEQHKMKVSQLDLQNEFVDWKQKGSTAELVGKVTEGGKELYKVKLTSKESKEVIFYFDAKTYLLAKSEVKANVMGEDMTLTTEISEYKELPIGIKVPFKTEQMGQAFVIEKYEVNIPIDPKVFEVK